MTSIIEKNLVSIAAKAAATVTEVEEKFRSDELFRTLLDRMDMKQGADVDEWAKRVALARVMKNKTAVNLKSFRDEEKRDEYAQTFTSLWLLITRMHDARLEEGDESPRVKDFHDKAHAYWRELVKRCAPSTKCQESDVYTLEGRIFGVGSQKGKAYKTFTVMSENAFRKYVETVLGCLMDGEACDYGKKRESVQERRRKAENRAQARTNTAAANGKAAA